MSANEPLAKDKIEANQHFTEPPPRFTEATLVKRMEELGIGRPSTYASTLAVLRDRDYVRIDKKRLVPEDKGRLVVAFLESFFAKYVEYDFTAGLEEQLDRISNSEIEWKQVLRDFWKDFSTAVDGTKELRTTQVLDALNDLLEPHIFPPKEDGTHPRACPSCAGGQLSLKVGKYGAFIGCSNYPECNFTRTLSVPTGDEIGSDGRPGVKVLGTDPVSGEEVTLRDGRFGAYVQLGEGEKPKRSSLPRGMQPGDVTLEKALGLLSLPREVAKHPTSGDPILAGMGRFGPYVQHGKMYASLSRDDDVLEIGANRAIDLIITKEQGGGARNFGNARALGDHPDGGAITVRSGRYGPYVNWKKVNATIPSERKADEFTLEAAIALIAAKQSGAGDAAQTGRVLGEYPDAGTITVREGRFGPYVNLGKVNATIPKSMDPASLTLEEAIELIDEKGGPAKPKVAKPKKEKAEGGVAKKAAKKAAAKKPAKKAAKKAAKKTPAKKAAAKKAAKK